ncbi:MAG: DinB family protein [Armatimonadetes bacterium]|nr:hypothetical protein [Armatimonadota bacterium]MBS1700372.1 DinB family protein [Armatimonadota bacterium]
MTLKEYIVLETEKSLKNVFESARKVSADKVEWKPLENGRSTLDQVQECAYCPLWVPGLLEKRAFDPSGFAAYEETRKGWKTLDECEAAAQKNMEAFKAAVDALPESDFNVVVNLPWGSYTLAEVMGFPMWNLHYHMGQINYIQTLYGDFSM